jgi:hypothetical protein
MVGWCGNFRIKSGVMIARGGELRRRQSINRALNASVGNAGLDRRL